MALREGKTMKIRIETHKLLGRLGNKDETYDSIISRLAQHYKDCPRAQKERESETI